MAKRKKTARTYRRRSVGFVKKMDVQSLAGVAVGAIAARFLASRFLASMDSKIAAGVQIAAGAFLSSQKNALVRGAGLGMVAGGAVSLGQSLNLIAGVNQSSYLQPVPSNEMSNIAGTGNSYLNYMGNPQGDPELQVIAGIGNPQGDAELQVIAGCDTGTF